MGNCRLSTSEARKKLYEIIREDVPFTTKAKRALELGNEYLGSENGHLTVIDRETDQWEALISTDPPDGQFPEGLELDLGTTYCRRTIAQEDPLALHDVPEQGWTDDPAFRAHGLHCYHGTTLTVDGETYGTVCFVGVNRRDAPFDDDETMFAELIARLLERELERERHETVLRRQASLIAVQNRVLRHNLRNEMVVIRGRVQHLVDNYAEEGHGAVALKRIDRLIELGEKARLLTVDFGVQDSYETTDLQGMTDRVAGTIREQFPDVTVTVDADTQPHTPVLPIFERALTELVENAAKYGGEDHTVTVTIADGPKATDIRIHDEGPGLPEREQAALETGAESPLRHGTGLGLWLVHWIVTGHGGEITAVTDDDGTTITISLPRTPETVAVSHEITPARDQYEAAFEQGSVAMLIVNEDLDILRANPQTAELLQRQRRKLLGQSLESFLPDDTDAEVWEMLRAGASGRGQAAVMTPADECQTVHCAVAGEILPGQHLLVIGNRPVERA